MFFTCVTGKSILDQNVTIELYIEPSMISVDSGENVTFTCSSPTNVSFVWHLEDGSHPFSVTKGFTTRKHSNSSHFWSSVELLHVKRSQMKKILCSAEGKKQQVSASLIVNGIRFGDICQSTDDCLTDGAQCLSGICSCPMHKVLLQLKPAGKDVCSDIIYKLYDSCEFSAQCYKLVDPHSLCGSNGICTCAAWAVDSDRKCVPKGEYSYNKNQEMYRVGLIAVTCVIIIIVAVSLWVTLRRSCHEQISITPRRRSVANVRNLETPRLSSVSILDLSTDKPPSYDELTETGDTVTSSPPNIKDALKNCITAKKLLRQASAPAGQLMTKEPTSNANQSDKYGCVSPVFTNDE